MINLRNHVIISDPCYKLNTWCQMELTNVLPGNYLINIEKNDDDRCKSLSVLHENYEDINPNWEWNGDIGVDSGQAGIFSKETYRSNYHAENSINTPIYFNDYDNDEDGELWYNKMCYLTCQKDEVGGSYDEGVVTSSGYGDGSYDVYIAKEPNGYVIGIKIIFID